QGNATVSVDTVFSWPGGWSYTFAPDGSAVDSVAAPGTIVPNDTLEYFGVPFEVIDRYEIGRFITPYGIGLSLGNEGFRWTYDVTDYQHLLRDSVDFQAGNQQELISVTFEMIEGTPPRPVVNMQRPWGGMASRSYASLSDDTALPPVDVSTHPGATQWALRTRLTGHGHNSNNGQYPHCCEWKDNTHYLRVNGTQVDDWHIWQADRCAENPVYPQGGTWLGSREGWCPGDIVNDHWVELTPHISGGSATLDYAIDPVPANNLGMGSGNYVVNMDLMEYGPASFALDAEIVEVKRPSSADMYSRNNPMCYDPLVVLRNAGSEELSSLTFTYSVGGGTPAAYTWTGSLAHMEQIDVTLPVDDGSFWYGDGSDTFTVTVSAPNGGTDMHAANDSYTTEFDAPIVYNEDIIVNYKTNNRPWENTVEIVDLWGNPVYARNNHTANTTYSDTLSFWAGCYTLRVLDTGNDGLSYWADPGAGGGFFRFRRLNGLTLRNFEPEFGRSIEFAFVIGDYVGVSEAPSAVSVSAFPNPSNGLFTLSVEHAQGPARMEVFDASGKQVRDQQVQLYGASLLELDLSTERDGLYQMRLTTENGTARMRLVKQ
ncbi:MAG: T9SS type A sorting domain-containing protein, partial [Flavobacteriales bacterium]|nr:T9SS type A sorting domain-containing protein [Flavobacteriales bacterium]